MDNSTALLIIDVQMVMFTSQPPVLNGGELVEKLASLIDRARLAGIPVIFVQHNQFGEHSPFRTGQPGWQIHPAIQPMDGEVVIQKKYPDSFQETSLQQELETRAIKNLIIAGLQTEFCIDTTCRRAYSLGYSTTLVQDAHSTFDTCDLKAEQIIAHHNHLLGRVFVTLKQASEIQFDLTH